MKDRVITVMQMVGNLDIGGAQEVVRTLVEYLALGQCQPVVCTLKDGPLRQDIERSGIPVEVLPGRRYSIVALPLFVIDMIRIWRALVRLVGKYDVDIIQTHLLGTLDFLVLLLRFCTRVRAVIWTFHNVKFEVTAARLSEHHWLLGPKKLGRNTLYGLTARWVSGFIAVSDQVKRAMIEIIGPIGEKITVICNGVDMRRYGHGTDKRLIKQQLGLDENDRLVAVVATLKEQKGHRYLIQALASLVPQHRDVHTLFIGDGPLKGELQSVVEGLHLGEHVHFLGNRYDIPELLAASDLFVLPSLWEGLPMALLEAMAAAKPVVATNVSGTSQVMIDNVTGILVSPGDVCALTQAIDDLLSHPAKAQKMGEGARQRIHTGFSARKQADEHIRLYHRLLETTLGSGQAVFDGL